MVLSSAWPRAAAPHSLPEAGDPVQMTDQALVGAARCGAAWAFPLLVQRYHSPLLRSLTRRTTDPDLAADLTQQTFLDAFRHLHRLPDDRPFAAWLYRIAHNHLLMEWRRQRLRRLISLDGLLTQAGPLLPGLCQPDGTGRAHERTMIEQALAGLSPPLRDALLLHSLGGVPSRDVAGLLGIAPEAARKRISRAKEQFRQRYRAASSAADADG